MNKQELLIIIPALKAQLERLKKDRESGKFHLYFILQFNDEIAKLENLLHKFCKQHEYLLGDNGD